MRPMTTTRLIAVAGLALFGAAGCGPVKQERLVQIESNHTAFRLPLEGKEDGKAFMSVDYLKAKRVPMQRYSVPQRLGHEIVDLHRRELDAGGTRPPPHTPETPHVALRHL